MNFGRNVGWSTLVAAAATVVMFFAAQGAMAAGISGTKHDLSAAGWNTSGQICIVCHAPHNAGSSAQLWNRSATTATYTLYASASLNATGAQPGQTSKLCLSCHDGTVALDSFGGATGTNFIANNASKLGTDLSNDHPVGFTYDAALATADGSLVSPSSASLVVAGVPLFSAKMECSSCHNVHDNANGDFLRVSNTGSALCLKCHNK